MSIQSQIFYPLIAKNSTAKISLLENMYEIGFFDYTDIRRNSFTEAEWNMVILLNDVLFEDDPFFLCTHPENDNYDEYLEIAMIVVMSGAYKDIDLLWKVVESSFDDYGCSSGVYKYFMMTSLQKVLHLKPFEYTTEESTDISFKEPK